MPPVLIQPMARNANATRPSTMRLVPSRVSGHVKHGTATTPPRIARQAYAGVTLAAYEAAISSPPGDVPEPALRARLRDMTTTQSLPAQVAAAEELQRSTPYRRSWASGPR